MTILLRLWTLSFFCKREGLDISVLVMQSNKVFNCHSRYLRWVSKLLYEVFWLYWSKYRKLSELPEVACGVKLGRMQS